MHAIKRSSLWIFYGLLAYMPLHIFLSTWLGTSFGVLEFAKVAKDIILVLGFLFAFCASLREPWLKGFLKDRLLWIILVYAVLTILLAVIKPTDIDAEILGVVYNLRFLLFFFYGILLTRLFDAKTVQKSAVRIVLIVGAVVVSFGIVQYIALPDSALKHIGYTRENGVFPAFFIDDKPDLERVMSTVRDPNSLGSYLIIVAPLAALAWLRQRQERRRLPWALLTVATSVCVYFTFSRSAWIGFLAALVGFSLLAPQSARLIKKYKNQLIVGGVLLLAVTASSLFLLRDSYFVQNTILHADQSTTLEDPNELRIKFFRESIDDITDNPLGTGPGTAGLASIRNNVQGTQLNENYYLQIASEVGVLGLLLFLTIFGIVGCRLFAIRTKNPLAVALLASFIGLAITNFLVHIWANEAVAYTWWGLVGVILGRHTKN